MVRVTEGYLELANEIILRAVEDYKMALRNIERFKTGKKRKEAEQMKNECERFFHSRRFDIFSRGVLDADAVIEKCVRDVYR